jgi:glycosyltransferase involved in cell wall biosynthesis
MRIAIATTQVPFIKGGAELHASRLEATLKEHGHQAEIVSIPFKWYPPEVLLEGLWAARAIDLSESNGQTIDRMIGLKFPGYLMRHPDTVMWVLHQHREAYDLWGTELVDVHRHPMGRIMREAVHAADMRAFSQAKALFANSRTVAGRLKRFNGLVADPLYHPPPLADAMRTDAYEPFFYYPSRISGLKRQLLVLDAMAKSVSPVRVVFSGGADNDEIAEQFRKRVKQLDLEKRAEWLGRVTEDEMLGLYARARGVIFVPYDEDLGYITLEAMLARKPVITTTDSGGPQEFVRDSVEGHVVPPEPAELARALDALFADASLAERMGEAGYQRYQSLKITWEHVVRSLTR